MMNEIGELEQLEQLDISNSIGVEQLDISNSDLSKYELEFP